MTYSEAVRWMMDECDRHGLHHEVLTEFIHEFERLFNENERLCRAGKEQIKPNFAVLARNALLEWDI